MNQDASFSQSSGFYTILQMPGAVSFSILDAAGDCSQQEIEDEDHNDGNNDRSGRSMILKCKLMQLIQANLTLSLTL